MPNSFKKNLFLLAVLLAGSVSLYFLVKSFYYRSRTSQHFSLSVNRGKNAFDRFCASCHDIRNDGIGPQLGGITRLIPADSLLIFIKNPDQAILRGNARAQLQQQKYRQQMPSFTHLPDSILNDIIAFVKNQTETLSLDPLSINDIERAKPQHLVPSVKSSDIHLILEDWLKIPRSVDRPPDKGIATLRAHPSGDGSLFVSDQLGVIYRIEGDQIDTFLYLSREMRDFIFEPGIGTGLGSFTLHPGFETNGLLYTTHTERYSKKAAMNDGDWADSIGIGLQWVLTEWKMLDVEAHHFRGDKREVLRFNTPTTAHGMQDIDFAPQKDKNHPDYGKLYLGIGDGGSNNIKHPELGHNLQSILGTILRIDPLSEQNGKSPYQIPEDNPYVADLNPNTIKEIWAHGFRNPHRLSWDQEGEQMFVADIGESNIEELNEVVKGGDYGWPEIEGKFGINTLTNLKSVFAPSHAQLGKYKLPIAQYDHLDGHAISGGYIYQGPYELLQNKYIFGDIVNGKLFFVNLTDPGNDSTVHEIHIMRNGQETGLQEITQAKRVHLRIGYDPYHHDLFIMTKGDGMIRKVMQAYLKENDQ